jgi:uncharacterized membrane protein (UPF0127 family)
MPRLKALPISVLTSLLLICGACGYGDRVDVVDVTGTPAPTSPAGLPVRELSFSSPSKSVLITAEIASTNEERSVGLMFRQTLPRDGGMLFIYPDDQTSGHWMRNTYIALDIAYLDSSGVVLEVRLGKPLDETVLRPAKPYRHALEMPAGWFAEHGLGPDSKLSLPRDLPSPR